MISAVTRIRTRPDPVTARAMAKTVLTLTLLSSSDFFSPEVVLSSFRWWKDLVPGQLFQFFVCIGLVRAFGSCCLFLCCRYGVPGIHGIRISCGAAFCSALCSCCLGGRRIILSFLLIVLRSLIRTFCSVRFLGTSRIQGTVGQLPRRFRKPRQMLLLLLQKQDSYPHCFPRNNRLDTDKM